MTSDSKFLSLTSSQSKHQIQLYAKITVQQLVYLIVLVILPKGVVRDEATFFTMLSILVVLVVVALILRRRRLKDETH
ncbi:MAG: hypothetical protein ACJ718_04120 [Nitrososphaeraceae archaeon]